MATSFEVDPLLAGSISGTMDAGTLEKVNIGTDSPATLIRADQAWAAQVTLNMTPGLLTFGVFEWHITLFLEDLTPAEKDYQFKKVVPTIPGKLVYNELIPAAYIPAGGVNNAVYKPTILVQLYNLGGTPPMPIAAFAELPVVNVYQQS
jgi:hypothetical protein